MFKQPSLSKISSRSLSKLKNKIELAFSQPKNNQNQQRNQKIAGPSRSLSTKSLAKSKCGPAEKHIPFSIAVKNGLISTEKKSSYFSGASQQKNSRKLFQKTERTVTPLYSQKIVCQNTTQNEAICGYSWFHKDGDELLSMCKNGKGQMMRYFAILKKRAGKTQKIVLAALDRERLYSGSKKYLLVKSSQNQLLNRSQMNEILVSGCQFILLLDQLLLHICNINKIITEIYELISDGLTNMDTIVKIIGRKIVDLYKKSKIQGELEDVFLLILLVESSKANYTKKQVGKIIHSRITNE